MPSIANKVHPKFVTFEGIEGAGKSTAVQFVRQLAVKAGIPHCVTREPGGTEIAEAVRQLVLGHYQEAMSADTEMLLLFASRAQHLANVILPALQAGQWVFCDRFTDASYAYQGGGRGMDIARIAQLEQWVQGDLRPDYVLLLDVPVALGMERIRRRKHSDRIEREQAQFFTRVREQYLARAMVQPERYKIIDASQPLIKVQQQLQTIFTAIVGGSI